MWRSLKSDIFHQLWIQWDRGSLFRFLQFTTKFCLHILEPRHSNITYFTFLYNFEKAQLGHDLFEKNIFQATIFNAKNPFITILDGHIKITTIRALFGRRKESSNFMN